MKIFERPIIQMGEITLMRSRPVTKSVVSNIAMHQLCIFYRIMDGAR